MDIPSLRSVAGGTLPRFAQSLGNAPSLRSVAGGCSLTSFSRWGDAPSLRSVAGGTLPCFAQSLGDALSLRSVAGGAPRFASSLSIKLFHRIANLVVSMHMTMVWGPYKTPRHKKSHTKIPKYSNTKKSNKKFQRKFPHKNTKV